SSPTLSRPSWNGKPMETVHPWGTIRVATPEANRATAEELSREEREEVRLRAGLFLKAFGYEDFFGKA
ncbi:MAG TPA: sulfotransferase, partial [Planctomycetota bacterium]|nr:sulfotransferase [Planctomycetota bacterium]